MIDAKIKTAIECEIYIIKNESDVQNIEIEKDFFIPKTLEMRPTKNVCEIKPTVPNNVKSFALSDGDIFNTLSVNGWNPYRIAQEKAKKKMSEMTNVTPTFGSK